uniref:Uncharacterized protein n=1 Tax=Arundo donax TaxID=35708 RepID=A0A0A9EX64_ARUDO
MRSGAPPLAPPYLLSPLSPCTALSILPPAPNRAAIVAGLELQIAAAAAPPLLSPAALSTTSPPRTSSPFLGRLPGAADALFPRFVAAQ